MQSTSGPGGTTTYHYDLLDRKIQVDDPSGSTKFGYDGWGNLDHLTAAANQRTEFIYDASGRLTEEIRPMQQSTGYEYDSQGRLWKILDAKNQTTEYGYDSQGRLETISYADGRSVTLNYDANGNLAGYDDGVSSASYTYDALGRKLSESVNYGTFSKTFSYSYHPSGQKASFTAPDGTVYEYAYGANNELREVKIPGLGAITIAEYQWNRPTTILYPGGGKRELEYDGLMRLTHLSAKDPGGNSLLDYSYDYEDDGNIRSKTECTDAGPCVSTVYEYDGASRLTSADNPTGADESYSYDVVGNRTSAGNATGSISHNANNELLSYGEIEFQYDDNGNMIQKTLGTVAVNYIYNADNRLIRVEDDVTKTVIAEYYYDPFGRRLWKDVAGTRTYFFYSDEGLVAEYDASGNELRSYGYQPDSTWTTDPLFLKQGSQYYFYQNDHLGTPQKLVAQNGAVVWSATYTAFGEANIDIETITNHLRFPGQYFDAETGLHYNYHRYYDVETGRYVTFDPIGFGGGEPNWYTYASNTPVSSSDRFGLHSSIVSGGIHIDPDQDDDHDTNWMNFITAAELEIRKQIGTLQNGEVIEWLVERTSYIKRAEYDMREVREVVESRKPHIPPSLYPDPYTYPYDDERYIREIQRIANQYHPHVTLRFYSNKAEFATLINTNTDGDVRTGHELLNSLTFYGHGSPGNLWLQYKAEYLTTDDITGGLLLKSAFAKTCQCTSWACKTADPAGGGSFAETWYAYFGCRSQAVLGRTNYSPTAYSRKPWIFPKPPFPSNGPDAIVTFPPVEKEEEQR